MKVTLPDFRRAGVLVVGDVMLDRYWYGPTSRISPEAPVPVVKVDTIEERPGGAANVAMNIASLGATSRLVGLTGIDDAARALSAKLNEVNVRCDFVSQRPRLAVPNLLPRVGHAVQCRRRTAAAADPR
ncbi:PfkB family carbohydrate kinase, partial [Serratia bockelmannii]|uniref:PfkB family carbohydrate kinase n=1 Tax=Serratia bockelmannii TaxID=2703793 RepID=UPI003CECAC3E